MYKIFTLILIMLLLRVGDLISAPGDVTIVRTIEFEERRIGWFDFPDDSKEYQRILLHFKLRCPPGKPCGEWDYLSHVFVNQWYAPSFRADKKLVEELSYMKDTSWTYTQEIINGEKHIIKSPKASILVEFYNNPDAPSQLTDSMRVWPAYYDNYVFDDEGTAIDSSYVEPDSVLILRKTRVYYDDEVTFNDRWEIFRYITPYGNGLDLGDGVTWTMDVTDLAPLLKGRVHLASPNGGWGDPYEQTSQEDLELTFEFIEGTAPRNVVNITKLWQFFGITYDKNFESQVAPIEYQFTEEEKTASMRVIQSGHGFGGTADNCAEFCRKLGMAKVDGVKRYEQYVWRECGDIPVYPQGGTWIYDRSNWCPGAEVKPYDYELTPFISPGSTHTVDYDMEYYDLNWTGGDNTKPNWVLTGFLFTYGDINHELDCRINEIIAPNNDRQYNRLNPVCSNPIIKIQNVGSVPITKVTLNYGNDPDNLKSIEMNLDSPLEFMSEVELIIPDNNFYNPDAPDLFIVEITDVNGVADENPYNNLKTVPFKFDTPIYFSNFTINLNTPNSDVLGINSPIQYYLEDSEGNVIFSRTSTQNSAKYEDDVELDNGCYRFTVLNTEGFGLGFWAYQSIGLKQGSLNFSIDGSPFKNFPVDWGNYYSEEFRVAPLPALAYNLENDTLDFGEVNLDEDKELELEIFPANESGLNIEKIELVLANNKKFSISSITPISETEMYNLKQGESVKIKLLFEPMSAGNKNAQLRIFSNDAINPQKQIILRGIGHDPTSVDDYNQLAGIDTEIYYDRISEQIKVIYDVISDVKPKISIFNLIGEKIDLTAVSVDRNQLYIPASNLPQGVYFVHIYHSGYISVKAVIVSRNL